MTFVIKSRGVSSVEDWELFQRDQKSEIGHVQLAGCSWGTVTGAFWACFIKTGERLVEVSLSSVSFALYEF
jgi:threonine/homoserine efflux transporter RhtA